MTTEEKLAAIAANLSVSPVLRREVVEDPAEHDQPRETKMRSTQAAFRVALICLGLSVLIFVVGLVYTGGAALPDGLAVAGGIAALLAVLSAAWGCLGAR
ncbi:hypothetical protein [Burkholderia pyrrocinia]|uniref:hypothetical protein n=1 Tax=Burkholderia pyrrocinia TaxID=60550 RepID=UPI0010433D62|nr:hypothetical protein [Burkholderia pyrrocinia]TDA45939.1 hypothetical protein EVG18_18840 [Burkholderia pyrrocinia]